MKGLKDFFHNINDILLALVIVAVAAGLIVWRFNIILEYPEQLAKQNAQHAAVQDEGNDTSGAARDETGDASAEAAQEEAGNTSAATGQDDAGDAGTAEAAAEPEGSQ